MDNGIDITLLNVYIFFAEIIAEIIWNKYNAKREKPLKLRYKLLMWSIVAFCVYLYDVINAPALITSFIDIIGGLLLGSILAGLMLGYCAELIVYISSLFFNFLSKNIKKKKED